MGYANAIKGTLASTSVGHTAHEALEDAAGTDIATAIDIHAIIYFGGTTAAHAVQIQDGDGGPVRIELITQNQSYVPFDPPVRVNEPWIDTSATLPSFAKVFYTPTPRVV